MAEDNMEQVTKLLHKMSLTNFDIGSSWLVEITHIENPQSFYIRPASYKKYLRVIQTHSGYLNEKELSETCTLIYNSKMLQTYVRGEICCIKKNKDLVKCDIYAVDYGFVEHSVSLKDMRKPYSNIHIPSLVTHCELANCKPLNQTWSEKSIEAMKYYIGNENIKMIVRGKDFDKLIVELINACPDDIATMLALTGYSTMGCEKNSINRFGTSAPNLFTQNYFLYKEVKADDVLHVRVQSGNTLQNFYVAEMSDYKKYLNERGNFTYFMKKQKQLNQEDIKEDKPVGVLNDIFLCKYERAIIRKIMVPETKVLVELVDWGIFKEVNLAEIKPMSEKFFFYPAVAIYCSAVEQQVWNNELQKCLSPGYEFLITIKEVGNKGQPNLVSISPVN